MSALPPKADIAERQNADQKDHQLNIQWVPCCLSNVQSGPAIPSSKRSLKPRLVLDQAIKSRNAETSAGGRGRDTALFAREGTDRALPLGLTGGINVAAGEVNCSGFMRVY
jgi:hypothetical protein